MGPVMTEITSSQDPTLKLLVLNTDKSMQCQFCGVNHDVRDFIRATLLHILDRFETSSMFKDVFKDFDEQQFNSKDMNITPMQEKSEIKEQGKERPDNLVTDGRGIAESMVEKSSDVNVIEVEQTKDGIKVTLRKVVLATEYIAAFLTVEVLLTVENTDPDYTIMFSDGASIATQGDYESKVTPKVQIIRVLNTALKLALNDLAL